jgi:Fibronectin type III domain
VEKGRTPVIRAIRNPHVAALAMLLGFAALAPANPAMAQSNAYNSIGLEWTAGGDDGTVGRASYYELKYSQSQPGGSDSVSIAAWWGSANSASGLPSPSTSGTTDSTRVTGLTPGATYYFVIRSVDDGGNRSPFSNIASGTTLTCNAPTSAPGSFQAVADTGRVDLSWSGTDPLATMIHIYRGTGSGGSLSLLTTLSNPTATGYTDTQVSAGTTYRYRVAWAASCADGPSTSTLSVTLPGTPPPPPAAEADAPKLHAYPNPSSGSSSVQFVIHVPEGASQGVLIRLYDLSGRWIATVADASYAPGDHTVSWNRVSRAGHTVSPGYYEAIGTVGGTKVRQRVLLTP